MSRTVLAAAALILASLVAGCDGGGSRPDPAVTSSPAWSDGRTVWWGRDRVETGQTKLLRSFTTTQDAVVWIAHDGEVWTAAPDREPVRIGSAGRTEALVADRLGSLVAWVDLPDASGAPATLTVYDTGSDEVALEIRDGRAADLREDVQFYTELTPWPPRDQRPLAMALALDDDQVWWTGAEGPRVTDVATGDTRRVDPEQVHEGDFSVLDASGSDVATWPFDPDEPEVSPPAEVEGVPLDGGYGDVTFSPDGRHVLVSGEVDLTSDGSTVLSSPDDVSLSQWVDADTVAGSRIDGHDFTVVQCELSGGDCTQVLEARTATPHFFGPANAW